MEKNEESSLAEHVDHAGLGKFLDEVVPEPRFFH